MSINLRSQIRFFLASWFGCRREKWGRFRAISGENRAIKLLIMFVASRNAKPLKLLEDLYLNEHKDGIDRGA